MLDYAHGEVKRMGGLAKALDRLRGMADSSGIGAAPAAPEPGDSQMSQAQQVAAPKHTPGPWLIAPADRWFSASGVPTQWGELRISAGSTDGAAENYYRIASVSNVNTYPENRANAHLIAGAPRLLSSLERAADTFADLRKYYRMLGKDTTAWEVAEADARAAIAAATGAQS
jgi:hypothetical protein